MSLLSLGGGGAGSAPSKYAPVTVQMRPSGGWGIFSTSATFLINYFNDRL